MSEITSKQKRNTSREPAYLGSRTQGALLLMFALAVCLLFLVCHLITLDFPHPSGSSKLFPMVLVTHNPTVRQIVSDLTVLILISITVFVVFRHRMVVPAVIVLLIGVGLMRQAWMISSEAYDITPKQEIVYEGTVYRLITAAKSRGEGVVSKVYMVLKCDETGLICGFFAAPQLIRSVGQDEFDETGVLFIDSDARLKLHAGFSTSSVEDERNRWGK